MAKLRIDVREKINININKYCIIKIIRLVNQMLVKFSLLIQDS